MTGPDKNIVFPLKDYNRLCFLKNIIKNPNIIVEITPITMILRTFTTLKRT